MNLPSNSPLLPSVVHFSMSTTISSPASSFYFPPYSIYFFLAFPFLFFLLPCTSWDNITQRTSLSGPKALTHSASIPLCFNPIQWGTPRDSDYNQVTAASAMPINVGGLKTKQGERGKKKKCLCPHLHTLPY